MEVGVEEASITSRSPSPEAAGGTLGRWAAIAPAYGRRDFASRRKSRRRALLTTSSSGWPRSAATAAPWATSGVGSARSTTRPSKVRARTTIALSACERRPASEPRCGAISCDAARPSLNIDNSVESARLISRRLESATAASNSASTFSTLRASTYGHRASVSHARLTTRLS